MPSITIENVPDKVAVLFWNKIAYDKVCLTLLAKEAKKQRFSKLFEKKQENRLIWLSKKEIEEKFYDKKDETYWPFVWADEFIAFLDRK